MKILKRTTLVFLILLNILGQVKAQNPLKGINDQLRSIFTPLNRPGVPPKEYLWDMSGHVTDPKFWNHYNTQDVLNTDDWYRLYWETFYMAYDTIPIDPDDSIYSRVMQLEGTIIPMGIRDIDYYYLQNGALMSNTYFDFDLVTNTISDIPGASSPYLTKNLFVAAPLYNVCDYNSVTFEVGSWIYADGANSIYYSGTPYTLQIDFGDGNGPIVFNLPGGTSYNVNYNGDGEHTIITQVLVDGIVIKESHSKVTTLGKTRPAFSPAN